MRKRMEYAGFIKNKDGNWIPSDLLGAIKPNANYKQKSVLENGANEEVSGSH